jgi:hypothetical protein
VTITAHYVFWAQKVWIDLIFFAVFGTIHAAANWRSPRLPTEASDREQAFSFVTTLSSSSLTAVGILLPLSLAAIATFAANSNAEPRVLANIFIADSWLALSLTLGLMVLWTAGFRAHTENVQNLRGIRLLNGWQLLTLLVGVARLLSATWFLVQTAH